MLSKEDLNEKLFLIQQKKLKDKKILLLTLIFDEPLTKKSISIKKDNVNKYIYNRILFPDFCSALNFWVNIKDSKISEIQKMSKDSLLEKNCGLRDRDKIIYMYPFEFGYYCPLCSSPIKVNELNSKEGLLEATKLQSSEYNYCLWCENCNIDIPELLCANIKEKNDIIYYIDKFIEIISDIKLKSRYKFLLLINDFLNQKKLKKSSKKILQSLYNKVKSNLND